MTTFLYKGRYLQAQQKQLKEHELSLQRLSWYRTFADSQPGSTKGTARSLSGTSNGSSSDDEEEEEFFIASKHLPRLSADKLKSTPAAQQTFS